jgi:hypothetical protein
MTWTRLDRPGLLSFLDSVKTSSEAVLFTPTTSEVSWLPLPFYHGARLWRLVNFASMPIFKLHFLGEPGRLVYLDGTPDPLVQLGTRGDLKLTPGNVIAYLDFYFFAVVMDVGEIFLVRSPGEFPFHDDEAQGFSPQFDFRAGGPAYTIQPQGNGGFRVETPLFLDGTLVRATLLVAPDGMVTIEGRTMMVPTDLGPAASPQPPLYPRD